MSPPPPEAEEGKSSTKNGIWEQQLDLTERLIQLQHARHQDHTTAFMTANSVLVAAITVVLLQPEQQGGLLVCFRSLPHKPELISFKNWAVVVMTLLGGFFCVLWAYVLIKVRVESKFRWAFAESVEQNRLGVGPGGIYQLGRKYGLHGVGVEIDGSPVPTPIKFPRLVPRVSVCMLFLPLAFGAVHILACWYALRHQGQWRLVPSILTVIAVVVVIYLWRRVALWEGEWQRWHEREDRDGSGTETDRAQICPLCSFVAGRNVLWIRGRALPVDGRSAVMVAAIRVRDKAR